MLAQNKGKQPINMLAPKQEKPPNLEQFYKQTEPHRKVCSEKIPRTSKLAARSNRLLVTSSVNIGCQSVFNKIYVTCLVAVFMVVISRTTIKSCLAAVKVISNQHKPSLLIETLLLNQSTSANQTQLQSQIKLAEQNNEALKLLSKSPQARSIEPDLSALSAFNKSNAIDKSQITGIQKTNEQVKLPSENKINRQHSFKFAYDSILSARPKHQRGNNRRLAGDRLQPSTISLTKASTATASASTTTTTSTTQRPTDPNRSRQLGDDQYHVGQRFRASEQVELGVGSFTLARLGDLLKNSTKKASKFSATELDPATYRTFDKDSARSTLLIGGRNRIAGTQELVASMSFKPISASHLQALSANNRSLSSDVGPTTNILKPTTVLSAQNNSLLSRLGSLKPDNTRRLIASGSDQNISNSFDNFIVSDPQTSDHERPPLGDAVVFEGGSVTKRRSSIASGTAINDSSYSSIHRITSEDFPAIKVKNLTHLTKRPLTFRSEMLKPILLTSGVKVHSDLMLVTNDSRFSSSDPKSSGPVLLSSSSSLPNKNLSSVPISSTQKHEQQSNNNYDRKHLLPTDSSSRSSAAAVSSDAEAAMTTTTKDMTMLRRLQASEEQQMPTEYLIEIEPDDDLQQQQHYISTPQHYYQSLPDQHESLFNDNQLSELLTDGGDQKSGLFVGYNSAPLDIDQAKASLAEDSSQLTSTGGLDGPTRREEVSDGGSWLSNSYLKKKLSQFKATAASSGIRVTADERSAPLVINSRGLIMAAKPNNGSSNASSSATSKPYNTSMLSNQVDRSLSPIGKFSGNERPHLQGSILITEGGDHHTLFNNRTDLMSRPTFLKKPITISGAIWTKNSSSSLFDGQPIKTHDLEAYNQIGERPSYNSRYNGSQQAEQAYQKIALGQAHYDDRTPVYEATLEEIFDEPLNDNLADLQVIKRPERNNLQQQQQQYSTSNNNNSSTTNNSSAFYHNPPYKQQMATNDFAQRLNSTSLTTGRTSANQTGNQSTTRKPAPKPAQVSGQSGKLQPYVGYTEVERIYMQSGSQQSERVGLAASASSAIYTTTTPPYDTTLAAELSNSSLSPPVNSALAYNNTFKTGNKLRNKLQHLIIGKVIKSQLQQQQQQAAAAAAAAAAASTPAFSLAAPPTPPPLLSSTVANNVANLLAQKFNFFGRPAYSTTSAGSGNNQNSAFGPLGSLFGIRLGNGNVNKFKQRINPFLNPVNSPSINRRTTGIGSLLFSGFIYGLSVLPALMALTGINPMSVDTNGLASASSPPSTMVNRHGKHARKVRPLNHHRAPANLLGPNQAALASSYAYLVPLVSAAAASLDSTAANDVDAGAGADDNTLDSIPTAGHSSEAQQSAIKALYAPPPTILEPTPSSLASLSSDYHPFLDSLAHFGNVEASSSVQPTVISLSQLTANDVLNSIMRGSIKSDWHNSLSDPSMSSSAEHLLPADQHSSGSTGSNNNLAGRQVRDIDTLNQGAYELLGNHLNLTEVRKPFGDEFAYNQLTYDDQIRADAGRGAISQSASSSNVRHRHGFARTQQPTSQPFSQPLISQQQQQQLQHNMAQSAINRQFNPDSNGFQVMQHWPHHLERHNQPYNSLSLVQAQLGSLGAASATPGRFVPATPVSMSLGNQQSATGVVRQRFAPQNDASTRLLAKQHTAGPPIKQQTQFDTDSQDEQAFVVRQRKQNFPTIRPATVSTTTESSPTNTADTDLIVRDPFGAQTGDSSSMLESLENFMSQRRRRTPPPSSAPNLETTKSSTLKPLKANSSSRSNKKNKRISAGGSHLYPTFVRDNQQSWQPNLGADKLQVGYTMSYLPLSTMGATKHSSPSISLGASVPSDDRDWRAIAPPKSRSSANSNGKSTVKKGARKAIGPHHSGKMSDLFSANSQRVYAVKSFPTINSHWPFAAANAIKRIRPKRKNSQDDGDMTTTTIPSLFGNDTGSELLMAHTMALGNRVLNEPASN